MSDQERLIRMWQENPLPGPTDVEQMMREIASRAAKFDRRIRWRNLREYAAGMILMIYFFGLSFNSTARLIAVAGLVAVSWVMFYLWWSSRQTPPLDPAADLKSYQAALLERYDRQIRLLSKVKYWYVLPLYLWMLLSIFWADRSKAIGTRLWSCLFVTMFAIFVVWLNEGVAVKKIRSEREKAEELIEDGKQW